MISQAHPPTPDFLALSPFNLVLTALWSEARGCSIEAQAAVACSFQNRLWSSRWGTDYPNVLLTWAQYSGLWPSLGGLDFTKTLDFARRVQDVSTFNTSERQLRLIVQGLFSNALIDPTHGATHYYDHSIAAPAWAKGAQLTASIGPFTFFTGVK